MVWDLCTEILSFLWFHLCFSYAIVMLPQGYETLDGYQKLCAELIECKFDVTATTIGGSGLEIREF